MSVYIRGENALSVTNQRILVHAKLTKMNEATVGVAKIEKPPGKRATGVDALPGLLNLCRFIAAGRLSGRTLWVFSTNRISTPRSHTPPHPLVHCPALHMHTEAPPRASVHSRAPLLGVTVHRLDLDHVCVLERPRPVSCDADAAATAVPSVRDVRHRSAAVLRSLSLGLALPPLSDS